MADDPVEAARKRQMRIMRGQSYFPAANLRQYEGTELAPPGRGTYFNPEHYVGASYGNQARAARELAKQYQSDLAFNVIHNPRQAQALEAERIGAQYGGGGTFAGRAGYQTVQLPGGGTTVVSDAIAKKLNQRYGNAPAAPNASYFPAVNNFQPSGIAPNPFAAPGKFSLYPAGETPFPAPAKPSPLPSPRFASERGDLLRDLEGTFYGGGQAPPTPTPTPTPAQPRRYFDYGFV